MRYVLGVDRGINRCMENTFGFLSLLDDSGLLFFIAWRKLMTRIKGTFGIRIESI